MALQTIKKYGIQLTVVKCKIDVLLMLLFNGESVISDGQHFHQYQQNEQLPLASNRS